MPKPRPNGGRERRMEQEIVVDAYTADERALSWYYHLEENLTRSHSKRVVLSSAQCRHSEKTKRSTSLR